MSQSTKHKRQSSQRKTVVWKPNDEEKAHLASFENKIEYMRNLARQCYARELPGCYIHGSPGISKTYSITKTLPPDSFKYIPGKCTGKAFFDLVEAHPDALIVLDDVSAIFNEPTAVQLFLAALSAPQQGSNSRKVSYYKSSHRIDVDFTGAVIALSNINLNGGGSNPILAALRSRVKVVHHDPSPAELIAFIRLTASKGMYAVSPKDCMEVAEFMLAEMNSLGKMDSINLRLFDTCIKTWMSWKNETITFHWKDMMRNDISQACKENEHPTQQAKQTIRTVKADNKEAVLAIIKREPKAVLQLEFAKAELGISRATFFNYKEELRAEGKVA